MEPTEVLHHSRRSPECPQHCARQLTFRLPDNATTDLKPIDRFDAPAVHPRRSTPGVAPVGSPFSRASVPLTSTCSTPSARVRPAA